MRTKLVALQVKHINRIIKVQTHFTFTVHFLTDWARTINHQFL